MNGEDSADLKNALNRIVDQYVGMSWLIVERDTKRIVGAAYDMRSARLMMPRNSVIKNVHTGAIVAVCA